MGKDLAEPRQGDPPAKSGARRSQRLRLEMPATVTSLDPATPLSETCKTFVVNAHGCGILALRPLAEGLPIRIELLSLRRSATGRVLNCCQATATAFAIGIHLDVPGNFWGVSNPPADWPPGPYDNAHIPAAEAVAGPPGKMGAWPALSSVTDVQSGSQSRPDLHRMLEQMNSLLSETRRQIRDLLLDLDEKDRQLQQLRDQLNEPKRPG